ncbi:VCBS repeat-containing protein [uncultured Chitinophaga sp.]|jgi:ASPIC and UnbV./FG-GAP repeat.|uniref:VCBS repeat-containing protein n=1 Tax=uncultured Chitinophaga sp. TaxID=339340 RepID=UPI00262BF24F|nr:VCBS repeat-containing protein [uncultured Chitinophaga sp.]
MNIRILLIFAVLAAACKQSAQHALFTALPSAQSGIRFSNVIKEDDTSASFINEFGYMGGGVGIGDFNNDGLKDIFFAGNQVSCRLYLNKGHLQFEDITEKAGVGTAVWATGVSIADVNNDGYDDIFVCTFGKDLQQRAHTLLFINQHDLTFRESAREYGLADSSYSTQAAFFDYDKDGDLDMYLLNYMLNGPNANTIFPKDLSGHSPANDKLYRNEGTPPGATHPVFKDVTLEAGIREDGYGLGIVISDLNNDGWPDIYVANDFLSNDLLWLNNHDGTFTNSIARSVRHQSYSSMGADVADINNDGLPDIATLDMMPEHNGRKKLMYSFMNYDRYEAERAMGYEPSFMRNMLQLNNGVYPGSQVPFFSEIGQLAGVSETDWSWSVLMTDFDNDGWKDMHITNGIGRDFINADFLDFTNNLGNIRDKQEQRKRIRDKLVSLDHIRLSNYLYLNNGDYTFTDASAKAAINQPSMSNGAAWADLDNDGDPDLVINNINDPAFVFINNARHHYLGIELKGSPANLRGFGAKVWVYRRGAACMQEQSPVRGYCSSVDQRLLFGLGDDDHADSVLITWPDNSRQTLRNIRADTVLTLYAKDAAPGAPALHYQPLTMMDDVTTAIKALYRHVDHPVNDFNTQRLLPQKYSQQGPYIATGDLNGDGRTDFFLGGAFNFSGQVFLQQPDGTFAGKPLADSTKRQEDTDCLLLDADGDKDLDLLIASGDTRYPEGSPYYRPRLYLNDGKGHFTLQANAIPPGISTITACVSAGDYDGDGDPDLFIGGRVSAVYPLAPASYILRNDKGIFTDVTAAVCPALQRAGMITSAIWTDLDNDHQPDLVIAGDWMPLRFFRNEHGRLKEFSTGLSQVNGMWRSLAAADIDNDGDMDLIAGNYGLNCVYRADSAHPMQLFAADLDGNGSIDPIPFYYIMGDDGQRRPYPAINRGQLSEQVPGVKKKFLYHRNYARATFDDLFKGREEGLLKFTCDETRSCFLENLGNGRFRKHPLPIEAQFAPVNAILCTDIDKDGYTDLLLAGNEYQADVMTGRYDALYGCLLIGSKEKTFRAVPPVASGFILNGDVKDLALIASPAGGNVVLAAVNNDSLKAFRLNHKIQNPNTKSQNPNSRL